MTNDDKRPFTDMYFIAALLSYEFERVDIDRDDPNRQKFIFQEEERNVYTIRDGKITVEKLSLSDIEGRYMSKRLLYPPTYPDILKTVKYSIHSYKKHDTGW